MLLLLLLLLLLFSLKMKKEPSKKRVCHQSSDFVIMGGAGKLDFSVNFVKDIEIPLNDLFENDK